MTHFTSKCCTMLTKRGRKYHCHCGVHIYVSSDKWTEDIEKVTCKKCRAVYNKLKNNCKI